jgi:outer membrane protein assembly factor BamD
MPSFFHKLAFILCLSLFLQACSLFSNETKEDEYVGWTVEQFIAASKEELEAEKYKKAIVLLEQLDKI